MCDIFFSLLRFRSCVYMVLTMINIIYTLDNREHDKISWFTVITAYETYVLISMCDTGDCIVSDQQINKKAINNYSYS